MHYSQAKLEEIYARGGIRYSLKIPPGYMDRSEKKDLPYKQYGDLILWLQLIDESKRVSKPIIFITDDTKKDWWSQDKGTPRPELIQEFFIETGSRMYIYSPKDFISLAKKYLHFAIDDSALKEIEEVKKGDEKYLNDLMLTELIDDLLGYWDKYNAEWMAERNSEPLSIDEGKLILRSFGEGLLKLRPRLQGLVDGSSISKFDELLGMTKTIQKHQVYVDGGVSYRKFWDEGDKIILVRAKYVINHIMQGYPAE